MGFDPRQRRADTEREMGASGAQASRAFIDAEVRESAERAGFTLPRGEPGPAEEPTPRSVHENIAAHIPDEEKLRLAKMLECLEHERAINRELREALDHEIHRVNSENAVIREAL